MGASSGARKAQQAQAAAESERQKTVAGTTARINSIYDAPARKAQQQDFVNSVRQRFTGDASRQKAVADRNLKFANARSGLIGGSQEVDSRKMLGDEFTRGILEAENKAQGALGDLQAQDEASRLNLINMARSGLDATTAANRANAATRVNLQNVLSSSTANGLGDIFGATAKTYKDQQEADARRKGQMAPVGSLYGSPFGR
jgi:hypothetical protein